MIIVAVVSCKRCGHFGGRKCSLFDRIYSSSQGSGVTATGVSWRGGMIAKEAKPKSSSAATAATRALEHEQSSRKRGSISLSLATPRTQVQPLFDIFPNNTPTPPPPPPPPPPPCQLPPHPTTPPLLPTKEKQRQKSTGNVSLFHTQYISMASLAASKPLAFTVDASDLVVKSKKPSDTPVKALSKAELQSRLDSADKRRKKQLTTKVGLVRFFFARVLGFGALALA